jgi:hypothetical protein
MKYYAVAFAVAFFDRTFCCTKAFRFFRIHFGFHKFSNLCKFNNSVKIAKVESPWFHAYYHRVTNMLVIETRSAWSANTTFQHLCCYRVLILQCAKVLYFRTWSWEADVTCSKSGYSVVKISKSIELHTNTFLTHQPHFEINTLFKNFLFVNYRWKTSPLVPKPVCERFMESIPW